MLEPIRPATPSSLNNVPKQDWIVPAGIKENYLCIRSDAADQIIDFQSSKLNVGLGPRNVDISGKKIVAAVQLCGVSSIVHDGNVSSF